MTLSNATKSSLRKHRCLLLKYQYKRKTWEGKMIKKMLKGRKQSDTYQATIPRYRWSAQMTMKKDNKLELTASIVTDDDEKR